MTENRRTENEHQSSLYVHEQNNELWKTKTYTSKPKPIFAVECLVSTAGHPNYSSAQYIVCVFKPVRNLSRAQCGHDEE